MSFPRLSEKVCSNSASVFVNGRSRPVIMDDMRSRIDRGDIKLERTEAIKVRILEVVYKSFILIHITLRQCVILPPTEHSNSSNHDACILFRFHVRGPA